MLLAGLRLRLIVVLQPDAPRAFRKAGIYHVVGGIGGVVSAPLGNACSPHELFTSQQRALFARSASFLPLVQRVSKNPLFTSQQRALLCPLFHHSTISLPMERKFSAERATTVQKVTESHQK